MSTFLLVHLQAGNSTIYQYPVVNWVKTNYPEVTVLDVDNTSDELLISYACRLISEENKVVIYFISESPDAPLGAALRIVETLISSENANIRVLVAGEHQRLKNIFSARLHISFLTSEDIFQLQTAITTFYNT